MILMILGQAVTLSDIVIPTVVIMAPEILQEVRILTVKIEVVIMHKLRILIAVVIGNLVVAVTLLEVHEVGFPL